MHRARRAVATAVAVLALTAIGVAPALAHHDPSPQYVADSQPGGYALYGFHHKRISATVNSWTGMQRHPNGKYRCWNKAQGDGRQLAATFAGVVFVEGRNGYGPKTFTTGTGATVYAVGAWHSVEDLALCAMGPPPGGSGPGGVTARYVGGASTGAPKCLDSWIIRRGQRLAYASGRKGC